MWIDDWNKPYVLHLKPKTIVNARGEHPSAKPSPREVASGLIQVHRMIPTASIFSSSTNQMRLYGIKIFNVKILAIVVIGLSLWLRYEWDFKHYVYELEAQKVFWTGPYILIASSSLALAVCAIGVWATVTENRQFLLLFALGSGISAILGLSGLAYTLSHGIYHSDLTPWLEDRFWVLFHETDYDERSARIMRIIQEDIECCGPSAWQDYQDFNKVVPDECRNTANGNLQTNGCAEVFARWMEPKTGWLSGIALLLVVIQLLSVGVSAWLRKIISQERRNDKPYRVVSTNTKV